MNILATVAHMGGLHGSALYFYETARGLAALGHRVRILSNWTVQGTDGQWLRDKLEEVGVECSGFEDGNFPADVQLASHFAWRGKPMPVVNVVHSEYDCETPIPGCAAYVCIRPSIQEHIVQSHSIAPEKCHVVFNGVDMQRFKPNRTRPANGELVVMPCTTDVLRARFIAAVESTATATRCVLTVGDNRGAKTGSNPFCRVMPATFHIEQIVQEADEVHGILLGRVNLEAFACGVRSWMWNPVTLDKKEFQMDRQAFIERHEIGNVCKRLEAILMEAASGVG